MKHLKLSGLLATPPDQAAHANETKLPEFDLLELVLQDEIDPRDQESFAMRRVRAGFEDITLVAKVHELSEC